MNVTGIIAARMSSSRFPGKVMLKVDRKTILQHMIDRMSSAKKLDNIIVATSLNPKDNIIYEHCQRNNIECYRGNENDLIDRYYTISKKINCDIIAKFGADCPLIDPKVIDYVITTYLDNDFDFVSNYGPPPKTYPEGMTLDVYSANILYEAFHDAKKPSEREHISPFFWNNPKRYRLHRVDYHTDISKYRFSLDYSEDFELIKIIFKKLYNENIIFTLEEIIQFLEKNPNIKKINSHIEPNLGLKRSFEEDRHYGYKP